MTSKNKLKVKTAISKSTVIIYHIFQVIFELHVIRIVVILNMLHMKCDDKNKQIFSIFFPSCSHFFLFAYCLCLYMGWRFCKQMNGSIQSNCFEYLTFSVEITYFLLYFVFFFRFPSGMCVAFLSCFWFFDKDKPFFGLAPIQALIVT